MENLPRATDFPESHVFAAIMKAIETLLGQPLIEDLDQADDVAHITDGVIVYRDVWAFLYTRKLLGKIITILQVNGPEHMILNVATNYPHLKRWGRGCGHVALRIPA